MQELIREAIAFIREHEPPEGYFVGFSGGKDSIVTLDLVRRSGVKHQAYYSMTLIDPPEVVRFIKKEYAEVICLKPDFTFWQGCMKKGIPTMFNRWCCEYLKHGTKTIKAIPLKNCIVGVRAEESANRAKRGRINKFKGKKGKTNYQPIFEWSSREIWEYIHGHGLQYPTLYDEGFARLGCIVCPFIMGKKTQIHRDRWPNIWKLMDITLNKLWERDKLKLIDMNFTYEEFMSWPNWKTKEERKQMSLFCTNNKPCEVKE
jgi:phosphoadenosine phosphosulfate reductase